MGSSPTVRTKLRTRNMNFTELNELIQNTFGASFKHVVDFTTVDETADSDGHYRVRYQEIDYDAWKEVERGVYVVVVDDQRPVYIGSFTRNLRRRWFYTRDKYLFHFKRGHIAECLSRKEKVGLYIAAEDVLQGNVVPENLKHFITAEGIEAALIRRKKTENLHCFEWNERGC